MSIYERAIKKWGEMQIVKAMEEAAEFIQACSRRLLGKVDDKHNLEEEIADLEIMLEQVKLTCNVKLIEEFKKIKLERLKKLLEEQ